MLNPSDLTKLVVQSPGGLTKTLRRLEDAGHIRRRPDPADRRALLVVLTDEGRRAAERANHELRAYYDPLIVDLSPEERASLTSLLRKVLDRLEVATGMTRSAWPPRPEREVATHPWVTVRCAARPDLRVRGKLPSDRHADHPPK